MPPNKSPKNRKPLIISGPSICFVIPERLERSTNRTGICHSIH